MQVEINRGSELIKKDRIKVIIGDDRYTISESKVDKRLVINKVSDADSDNISVHPRYANEIELS